MFLGRNRKEQGLQLLGLRTPAIRLGISTKEAVRGLGRGQKRVEKEVNISKETCSPEYSVITTSKDSPQNSC